jgi:hypothetical protein
MKVTGHCHCGHITYEAEVDPATVRVCHCIDCQKLTGTAFRAAIASLPGTFVLKSRTPKIGLPAERCERHWVSDIVRQEFFGDDCRNPSRDPATLVHCLRALVEWDVPGAAAALKRLERKRRAACARRTARVRRQGAHRAA